MTTCIKMGLRYYHDGAVYASDLHVADDGDTLTIISATVGDYASGIAAADVEVLHGMALAPDVFYGVLNDISTQLSQHFTDWSSVRVYNGQSVLVVRR